MSTLYPRLLVDDFAAAFRFYQAVLPELTGATLARGDETGPYASWDAGEDTALALFDRAAMDGALGGDSGPAAGADRSCLVVRVDDVDTALARCARHGGEIVTPARARPEWGPTMRTAHLRAPEGTLLELQSY